MYETIKYNGLNVRITDDGEYLRQCLRECRELEGILVFEIPSVTIETVDGSHAFETDGSPVNSIKVVASSLEFEFIPNLSGDRIAIGTLTGLRNNVRSMSKLEYRFPNMYPRSVYELNKYCLHLHLISTNDVFTSLDDGARLPSSANTFEHSAQSWLEANTREV